MFGHLKKNYALSLSYLVSTALSLILAAEHSFRAASRRENDVKKHFHTFCSSLWLGLMFLFGTEALQAFMNESVEKGRKEKTKEAKEAKETKEAEPEENPVSEDECNPFKIQLPKG